MKKYTAKTCTPFGKLAKELNSTRKTKTPAKTFSIAPASWTASCILTAFLTVDCFAQQPQQQQVGGNLYDRYKNWGEEYIMKQQGQIFTPTPTPFGLVENPAVTGARQVIYYRAPSNNNNADYIFNKANKNPSEPKFEDPNANNKNKNPLQPLTEEEREKRQSDNILNLLNEAHTVRASRNSNFYQSPEYLNSEKTYNAALQNLQDMLAAKKKLSIKDALFEVENAFGNSYLNKKEYDEEIKKSKEFMGIYAQQNGYDLNKNEDKHTVIQKFMREKLTITIPDPDGKSPPKTRTHEPFTYDFEDYKGEFDHRNFFLTKILATGTGQCNSLTNTYLAFCEALGAEVYLSFAPIHAFVKYTDSQGKVRSYEPTTGRFTTDKWYQENLYVSDEAKRNGIYLSPLNKKQIVASSIVQLAAGYKFKNGIHDGKYINKCADEALKEFPNKNLIQAIGLYSRTTAYKLDELLWKNNVKTLDTAIYKIKGVPELVDRLFACEAMQEKLGWEPMPNNMYEKLMQDSEFRGQEQKDKNIPTKQKRNLFNEH
ncbi:MAG: hypothetical protein HY841_12000 [Bacteroidetes bacterium]|nr:hypothetical protein [Bacteroidota bacterium]